MKPQRALISVWDKTGIVEFARELVQHGVEILSTSKTAKLLNENGIKTIEVSEFTGSPEILGGRVKTLHPKIFAGILSYRNQGGRDSRIQGAHGEEDIAPIDIVVVSLYPFEENLKKGLPLDEMIELIDIGGVSLLRAAAKNYEHVAVVPDRYFYEHVVNDLKRQGEVSLATRKLLAAETFSLVTHYDAAISEFLAAKFERPKFGTYLNRSYAKAMSLRYGENPHQQGFYYADPLGGLEIKRLWGKELSYNNLLDVDSTLAMLEVFEASVCTIVKHNTPCAVARHTDQKTAYANARSSDPKSAFGGIVGFSGKLEAATAAELVKPFYEVIVAPEIEPEALELLKQRKNLRVIEFSGWLSRMQMRTALSGVLVQEADFGRDIESEWKVVSARKPTEQEWQDMKFAWTVTRFVRSNAIVLAHDNMTVGIGAGQMSRVDSVEIAIKKSEGRCAGGAMASDGFFPFRDSIDIAAANAIAAAIEPGGSMRDEEVIKAADESNIALVFTGTRHFRH
jgi:phosphoribosylaminoimidazolecarboxamide formyltransferase/IMP cyclohydrolase